MMTTTCIAEQYAGLRTSACGMHADLSMVACRWSWFLSGSMEPGFYRGDILFLYMGKQPVRAGEIVVFSLDGREIPIVHRVIKLHERQPGGRIDILTKVQLNLTVELSRHICTICSFSHARASPSMLT